VTDATLIPYKTSVGQLRLRFNVESSHASLAIVQATIPNVSFVGNKAISATSGIGGIYSRSLTLAGSGTLYAEYTAASTATFWSGDVPMSSWPAWATKENSFSGTIVAPVAVKYDQSTSFLDTAISSTAVTGGYAFKFAGTPDITSGSDIYELDNSGTYTKVVMLKDSANVRVEFAKQAGVNQTVFFQVNDDGITKRGTIAGAYVGSAWAAASYKFKTLKKGDYITLVGSGNSYMGGSVRLEIKADALDTGMVASTTDVIYKYAHNKTSTEKVVGKINRGAGDQPLYEKTLFINENHLVNDAAYLSMGTGLEFHNAVKYNANYSAITTYGEGANTARVIYELSSGNVGLYLGGSGAFYSPMSIDMQYTKNSENP
jgi:hypothetical protein